MGFSNLTMTPERLENMRKEYRPKFERDMSALVVSKGGNKSRARAIHVARYSLSDRTGYLQWSSLCSSPLQDACLTIKGGDLNDVSCLRCQLLISIVEGIELYEGEYTIEDCPLPLL